MNEELKPCPWCGATPRLSGDEDFMYVNVESGCLPDCPVRPMTASYENTEDVIAAWNTRPIEEALRAELAAAQTEIKQLQEAIDIAVDDLNNESYQHGGFGLGIPDGVSLSWVRGVVENLATMTPRLAEQERSA